MSQRFFITLGSRHRKEKALLELPGDKPIREWLPDLIQAVGWKEWNGIPMMEFFLETEEGERLPESRTLQDSGICSSDLLFLSHDDSPAASPTENPAECGLQGLEIKDVKGGNGSSYGESLLRQPRLLGPGGLVFLLDRAPVTLGRSGKGSAPDIDLAEWDSRMIISRRHAVIEQTGDGVSIKPEKTTNGTFLNGVEVSAGETRILHDGDKIHFGFKGLELVFHMPI
jgi:hypothetical protein